MRFHITKTDEFADPRPCEQAIKLPGLWIDARTFKSPEEHDNVLRYALQNYSVSPWLSEGVNHRLTETGIARDIPGEFWFIDFPDLESLVAFSERIGGINIRTGWLSGYPTIDPAKPE